MVSHPGDHAWSSYRRNAEGGVDPLVSEHALYRALGAGPSDREAAYRQAFERGVSEAALATLRDATQRGWVAGRDGFRAEIEAALGRRVDAPVRGRPRNAEISPLNARPALS